MKKRMTFVAGLVLAMTLLCGMVPAAHAMSPAPVTGEPPLPPAPVDVRVSAEVVGQPGNWYRGGDLLVLTASVENNTDETLSGDLWLTYPDTGCVVVAEPVLLKRDGLECYAVDGLEPGMGAEAVVVLRAPDRSGAASWTVTANFAIADGGGCIAVATDLNFGKPVLKADKSALLKDGVLKIRNFGDGGASKICFRFLAKKEYQNDKNLPEYAKYVGEGRIEIQAGGLLPGGKVERDISGLLHERMDPKHVFEISYEDWEEHVLPEESWVDGFDEPQAPDEPVADVPCDVNK